MKCRILFKMKDRIEFIKVRKKDKKDIEKIMKSTIELKNNITNENVINYIVFIKDINIPNKILCKNIIVDAYKLIKDSEHINDKLKVDLRILLECKGVSFAY